MAGKKKKYDQYKQGNYHPVNKEKYKGTLPVIYRSSWELKLFIWLDRNSSCISWGSESTIIRYVFNGAVHRYYLDATAVMKDKNGGVKKYYIEIKPYRQTQPPIESTRKKAKTLIYEKIEWAKNQAKWKRAKEFAKKQNAEFVILTEKDLFKDK